MTGSISMIFDLARVAPEKRIHRPPATVILSDAMEMTMKNKIIQEAA